MNSHPRRYAPLRPMTEVWAEQREQHRTEVERIDLELQVAEEALHADFDGLGSGPSAQRALALAKVKQARLLLLQHSVVIL